MINVLDRETDIQSHIRNFNTAWMALSSSEQMNLIEAFRIAITRASSGDPGMMLSASAYM